MNEDMATEMAGRIIAAIPGWSEDASVELIREIELWNDDLCAEAAVMALTRGWTSAQRPTLGRVIQFYNEAVDVKRRREAEAPRPQIVERYVSPKDGREVAFQAYRRSIGLPDNAESRARFGWGTKEHSRFVEGEAPDVDVDRALGAIGTGTTYAALVVLFHGDHLRTRRAIRTLQKRRVVSHDDTGWIRPLRATAQ